MPAKPSEGVDRGYIVPIGGAENKLSNPAILEGFVEICGGTSAHIAIIPTASELEETGPHYRRLFRKIGVRHADVLPIFERADCNDDEHFELVREADGLFSCDCRRPWAAPSWHGSSGAATRGACTSRARPPGRRFCRST